MNNNETMAVATMSIEPGRKSKRKGVLIIAAFVLANILIVGFVLSWRL